ncbi:TPA: his operon leader peptide [Klebsiella pneumoniae]|nr:hypothetical protein AM455_06905 [Klebsiella pneumoniae]EKU0893356.1 his operon leader peptide [Klebsiella pneumoniae]EKW3946685.1 his operon leader peptide [Klebsiella pneumoniae]EKZ5820726.1 his operon leader peptide [Klebsiella pneumoniae]USU90425.1 his operon leader peptide [Klebsiella pneumoniae]
MNRVQFKHHHHPD